MTKDEFYMHLCYYLLNKFCNNAIQISAEEWNACCAGVGFIIKHRVHNNCLEVVAGEETKQ